jgi:hypothetical protein
VSLGSGSKFSVPLVSADADEGSGAAALLFALVIPSSPPSLSTTKVTAMRLSPRGALPELLLGGDVATGGLEELRGSGLWPARCMEEQQDHSCKIHA